MKLTPLDAWIARGDRGHFVAKRLRGAVSILTQEALREMQVVGESFSGKDYDLYFEWSDERIYCSELVWKIFQRGAGIEIGELAVMGDFGRYTRTGKMLYIRRATADDALEIERMVADFVKGHPAEHHPRASNALRAAYFGERPGAHLLVAERRSKIVGYRRVFAKLDGLPVREIGRRLPANARSDSMRHGQ